MGNGGVTMIFLDGLQKMAAPVAEVLPIFSTSASISSGADRFFKIGSDSFVGRCGGKYIERASPAVSSFSFSSRASVLAWFSTFCLDSNAGTPAIKR